MKSFKTFISEAPQRPDNKPEPRAVLMVQDPNTKNWRMDRTYNTVDDAKQAGGSFTSKGLEIKVVPVPSRREEIQKDLDKEKDNK